MRSPVSTPDREPDGSRRALAQEELAAVRAMTTRRGPDRVDRRGAGHLAPSALADLRAVVERTPVVVTCRSTLSETCGLSPWDAG